MKTNLCFSIILLSSLLLCSSKSFSTEYGKTIDRAKSILYQDPEATEIVCLSVVDSIGGNREDHYTDYLNVLILLGRSYDLQGDFDLGISIFYEALDHCDPSDKGRVGDINARLAALYNCLNDHAQAFQFSDVAIDLYSQIGDSMGIAYCYNMKGLTHCFLDEYQHADYYFTEALQLYTRLGSERNIAAVLNNMGLYAGDSPKKIKQLEEAIIINRKHNSVWSLAENYNNLGMQYFFAGDYRLALKNLDKALEYAQAASAKELIYDNHKYRADIYDSLSRYDKAYEHFLIAYKIEQEIQSEKKLRSLERHLSKEALLKKITQIELMEEKHRNDILNKSLLFSILFFVLVFFLIYFLYRKYKVQKANELYKTKLELEESNSELLILRLEQQEAQQINMEVELLDTKKNLTNFSCYIKNRNEILGKIKNMIKEAYKMESSLVVLHLRKINAFITQCETTDDNKLVFISELEHYNKAFLDNLNARHPDLSKSEKQLASYLRMELSTKDISLMTGSNAKAITMARYRLRKRLGLDSDDSISDYLQQIG